MITDNRINKYDNLKIKKKFALVGGGLFVGLAGPLGDEVVSGL